MFMYKIIQYLLFGHINLVRIFSIQHYAAAPEYYLVLPSDRLPSLLTANAQGLNLLLANPSKHFLWAL